MAKIDVPCAYEGGPSTNCHGENLAAPLTIFSFLAANIALPARLPVIERAIDVTFKRLALHIGYLLTAGAALAVSPTAHAKPNVATDSAVFVERSQGAQVRRLEPAKDLSRGDRVVTIVRWYRLGGDGGFTITNPMPNAIYFQRSTHTEDEVSVDGGKTWGKLEDLRIGSRVATPEDVTHIRWHIPANQARIGAGQIAYSGIVR